MIRAYNMLHNGMGGLDWAGLPVVVGLLGAVDIDRLAAGLLAVRRYKQPGQD